MNTALFKSQISVNEKITDLLRGCRSKLGYSPPPYFHEKRIPDFPEFFNQLKFLLFSLLSFIYSRNKLPLHILITEVNFEMRQLDTVPETDIYNVNYF